MNNKEVKQEEGIWLISLAHVSLPTPIQHESYEDSQGGEQHGLPDVLADKIFWREYARKVPQGKLNTGISKAVTQLNQMLEHMTDICPGGLNLNTVTVSLAISAEGNVGIVTGGMEGSIQLTFQKNQESVD